MAETKTFAEQVQEKRAQDAEDFKEIAATARVVAAIKDQTAVLREQNQKLDKIIELLGTDEQDEPDEPEPAKLLD